MPLDTKCVSILKIRVTNTAERIFCMNPFPSWERGHQCPQDLLQQLPPWVLPVRRKCRDPPVSAGQAGHTLLGSDRFFLWSPGPRLFLSCPIDVDGSRVWFTDLWNYSIIPYLLEAVREGLQVSGAPLWFAQCGRDKPTSCGHLAGNRWPPFPCVSSV